MKRTPHATWTIGLLQSTVVFAYILLFTVFVQLANAFNIEHTLFNSEVGGPILFLMVFVFSALVCSGSILGYPLVLLFNKQVRRAVEVVLWSAFWLGTFAVALLTVGLMS